jgi:hypothetical protein
MKSKQRKQNLANYFGLVVEVIDRMENYSMICYHGRNCIVETTDLVAIEISRWAA